MVALTMSVERERWQYRAPFRIAGYTRDVSEFVVVTLHQDGKVGRGEAAGVRYRNENAASMVAQIEALRDVIEGGIDRHALQEILAPGGARNAIDCAMWDLEAKLTGQPAWQRAGLSKPHPVLTDFTCGAESPQEMVATALGYEQARAIKLKLTGEMPLDAERVVAVRKACPTVWLSVDANQAFKTCSALEELMPVLIDCRVEVIEQPFAIGQESLLDGFDSPIPIHADESVQRLSDLPQLLGRFQGINIKLDKCGGLTEGLQLAREARARGLEVSVGNMVGTSLAMAPGVLLGQLCKVVDLDGPLFLKADRAVTVRYSDGYITCPEELWGHA
ncbi:MAG TPA: dipeptide epimerase [Vicinamibacterales bacterium]|nr:dipeptide epimerase [Vicinamibacterales bacterium]